MALALRHRGAFIIGFMAFVVASFALGFFLGDNFFPTVDSGEIYLHVRAPIGTRIEETAALFDHIEEHIRSVIPPDQLDSIVDNIGLPVSGINRAYSNDGGVGPEDGDILVTLTARSRSDRRLCEDIAHGAAHEAFRARPSRFCPPISSARSSISAHRRRSTCMVAGPDKAANEHYARALMRRIADIPGAADVRLQQSSRYPEFAVDVDRTRADEVGITERDVTNSLVVNLARQHSGGARCSGSIRGPAFPIRS